MTKLWTDAEVAGLTPNLLDVYESTKLDRQDERCWLVKRKADGKVVKSPSYSEADLGKVVKELDELARKPFMKRLPN